MKRANERKRGLEVIIDKIKISGPMTQTELKEESNLLGSTASYLVNDLRNIGLLIDSGELIHRNGPGKPAAVLKLNSELASFIGIYLEDCSINMYVTGLDGEVLDSTTVPIDHFKEIEEVMIRSIKMIVSENPKIRGIGIAVKGIVYNDGTIKFGYRASIREENWKLQGLQKALESAFPDIHVVVENDANCTAVLFQHKQRRKNMNIILYLLNISPFGIGCSILQEGSLYRGSRGSAGQYFEKSSYFSRNADLKNRDQEEIEHCIHEIMSHVRMSGFLLDPEQVILSGSIFDDIEETRLHELGKLVDDYNLPFKVSMTRGNKEYNPAAGAALISTDQYISRMIDKVGVR